MIKLPSGREISSEDMKLLCATYQEQALLQFLYDEGRSAEQAAKLLGTNSETVQKLHQKALARMDRLLERADRFNLKRFLMEFGNKLVLERKFLPPGGVSKNGKIPNYGNLSDFQKTTDVILLFTQWLNNSPEALEVLEEMGIDFPVSPPSKKKNQ